MSLNSSWSDSRSRYIFKAISKAKRDLVIPVVFVKIIGSVRTFSPISLSLTDSQMYYLDRWFSRLSIRLRNIFIFYLWVDIPAFCYYTPVRLSEQLAFFLVFSWFYSIYFMHNTHVMMRARFSSFSSQEDQTKVSSAQREKDKRWAILHHQGMCFFMHNIYFIIKSWFNEENYQFGTCFFYSLSQIS